MATYTTVDDVCARFPKLARWGAPQAIASAARAANIVTLTFAAPHGANPGWSAVVSGAAPAGATAFDGAFTVASAPSATALTYAQQAADDTATGGAVSLAPPGVVSDGQIEAWIADNGGFLEAIAAARGYNLAQLPAATAKDAMTLLAAVNKVGVQVLLGEAIAARAGITGAWQTLDNIRAEYSDLLKSLRAGAYDKLFIANARTEDALPQLGGWVPGIAPPPCQRATFRKDKLL